MKDTDEATPIVIRVTGGIGSGKSAFCAALEKLGATLFNADAEAKRLMTEDEALRTAITDAFGASSYLPDGSLNRQFLADRVFGDHDALVRLNALVHPAVFRSLESAISGAAARGIPYLVYEAALLSDREGLFDVDVVIDSPLADRVARVGARDSRSEESVLERAREQPTRQQYLERADYVVLNDGSLDELRSKAAVLLKSIESDFFTSRRGDA